MDNIKKKIAEENLTDRELSSNYFVDIHFTEHISFLIFLAPERTIMTKIANIKGEGILARFGGLSSKVLSS